MQALIFGVKPSITCEQVSWSVAWLDGKPHMRSPWDAATVGRVDQGNAAVDGVMHDGNGGVTDCMVDSCNLPANTAVLKRLNDNPRSSFPQIRIEFVIAPAGHSACPAYPAGLRAPGADEGESACQRCGSTMAV